MEDSRRRACALAVARFASFAAARRNTLDNGVVDDQIVATKGQTLPCNSYLDPACSHNLTNEKFTTAARPTLDHG
jgi:hypothetical protein